MTIRARAAFLWFGRARGLERWAAHVREFSLHGNLLLACYTGVVCSLYGVFVPQSCEVVAAQYRTCTFQENFVDLTAYNVFVLFFNLLAGSLMLAVTAYELRRERFILAHFDVDGSVAEDNLLDELAKEGAEGLAGDLLAFNKRYFHLQSANVVFALVNALLSLILVCLYWDGFKTLTTFASNFALVAVRCTRSLAVAHASQSQAMARSIHLNGPVTFNVLSDHSRRELREASAAAKATAVEAAEAAATAQDAAAGTHGRDPASPALAFMSSWGRTRHALEGPGAHAVPQGKLWTLALSRLRASVPPAALRTDTVAKMTVNPLAVVSRRPQQEEVPLSSSHASAPSSLRPAPPCALSVVQE